LIDSRSRWDPGRVYSANKLRAVMRLIRIEHTIFSLPFAYVGIALSGYACTPKIVLLSTLAVFGLRSASMAFNNIADFEIDRKNPRTSARPLISGALSFKDAWIVVAIGSLFYFLSALLLNLYAFAFSPILYVIAMSYPYAKRLHPFPHIHLGLALGFVVFGGAVAASGGMAHSFYKVIISVPWLYLLGVTFWVAGFDTIYSIMDLEFDRKEGLGSIPALIGPKGAVFASSLFYAFSILSFSLAIRSYALGMISTASTLFSAFLMLMQIILVSSNSEKIPLAFNLNLVVGVIVSVGVLIEKAMGT